MGYKVLFRLLHPLPDGHNNRLHTWGCQSVSPTHRQGNITITTNSNNWERIVSHILVRDSFNKWQTHNYKDYNVLQNTTLSDNKTKSSHFCRTLSSPEQYDIQLPRRQALSPLRNDTAQGRKTIYYKAAYTNPLHLKALRTPQIAVALNKQNIHRQIAYIINCNTKYLPHYEVRSHILIYAECLTRMHS